MVSAMVAIIDIIFPVDNHFTAHCEMIFAVIDLQFAVINLQFAVIDYQNVSLLWNNLQPHKINRYTIST